ncbi:MAG: hypothetical protein KKA73_24630 [Chloroflexi bacterium]|nr:hypothetical protein [Chloroflexota bacterium]MBU1750881.1 hypothetical protein [Chloroflexota bacterium]
MKLFSGTNRTDYQDILRAIGHYVDQQQFSNVRVLETEEGIILQGTSVSRERRGEMKAETYLLTAEDLESLLREAYARRGKKL